MRCNNGQAVFWLLVGAACVASALNPVIMIPGDGGSQIEAKINKTKVVHYICAKTSSSWYTLWLNLEQMVPEVIDCWADNMKLVYDNATRTTRNADGVLTRVPGFGNTSSVEWLDPSRYSVSTYFSKIAAKLVQDLGYTRGGDLHGAPYDFRKAANEHDKFFTDLKALIEKTYSANGNSRVALLTHSMGSPMALYFLNRQSQAWKDKHVLGMVTLAGVWGGTVRAMKVFAVGDNLGAWIVSKTSLMVEQRSNPSLAWLMPSDKLWKEDEVLVQSPTLNVTVNNFGEFYSQLGHPEAALMREDVAGLVRELEAPGVPVHCIHGSGVPTTEKLVYSTFPTGTPVLNKGDGDGTVNIRSLLACTQWEKKQKQPFRHKVFPHVDHLKILSDDSVVEHVKDVIKSLSGGLGDDQEEEEGVHPDIEIIL